MWWFERDAPHNRRHLSAWTPVGGSIWGGLGGLALLEEVCLWKWLSEFKVFLPFPGLSLLGVLSPLTLAQMTLVPSTCHWSESMASFHDTGV